jgi:hypothetical protein
VFPTTKKTLWIFAQSVFSLLPFANGTQTLGIQSIRIDEPYFFWIGMQYNRVRSVKYILPFAIVGVV